MKLQNQSVRLPDWLDELLYKGFKAEYKPRKEVFAECDSDPQKAKQYLGTYFPRSYCESYCIFSDYLKRCSHSFTSSEKLNLLDWGCGSGGDLIGALTAILEKLSTVKKIRIRAYDANQYDVDYCRVILAAFVGHHPEIEFSYDVEKRIICRREDFGQLLGRVTEPVDVVLTFKALGELISKGVAIDWNPYSAFLDEFKGRVGENGIICIGELAPEVVPMDCPREGDPGYVCPTKTELCPVNRQCKFLLRESKRKVASFEGCHDGSPCKTCSALRGLVNSDERLCPASLSKVYYRDLMNVARKGLCILSDNLEACQPEMRTNKEFNIQHSKANEDESLFWMIVREIPKDDLPW